MATKTTPKKPAKKSTVKKAPVKRPAAKKRTASKSVAASNVSTNRLVNLVRDEESFMTFRVNRETFYWVILGVVVIAFSMWIMKLQSDIQSIYDQIDYTTSVDTTYVPTKKQ